MASFNVVLRNIARAMAVPTVPGIAISVTASTVEQVTKKMMEKKATPEAQEKAIAFTGFVIGSAAGTSIIPHLHFERVALRAFPWYMAIFGLHGIPYFAITKVLPTKNALYPIAVFSSAAIAYVRKDLKP